MKIIAKWLYKKIFNVEWMLLEWEWEHNRKVAELSNTLEHIALKKLGYRVKTNIQAKYYVEGQLPDAPLESLYSLEKIGSTPPVKLKKGEYKNIHNLKGCKCPKGSDVRFCLGKGGE